LIYITEESLKNNYFL